MTHTMKLKDDPFNKIASGRKTIELRLYDKKRQAIKVGDRIEFTKISNPARKLLTEVTALHLFPSFQALYDALPLKKCGYSGEALKHASYKDMEQYYSPEEQAQYGVVGIELRLLNSRTDDLTATSRFISMVLRHKPEEIGISLDEHGWADVQELIAGVGKRYSLDTETLEKIVATDEKQRYAFNEDHTLIRANQGHSIPVDVELEEVQPPEILYHGTGEKFLGSITAQGLLPKSRLYVHLSADAETAKTVGARHGKPVVLTVMSGQMQRDGFKFYRSQNGVWLTKYVPSNYLTQIEI